MSCALIRLLRGFLIAAVPGAAALDASKTNWAVGTRLCCCWTSKGRVTSGYWGSVDDWPLDSKGAALCALGVADTETTAPTILCGGGPAFTDDWAPRLLDATEDGRDPPWPAGRLATLSLDMEESGSMVLGWLLI